MEKKTKANIIALVLVLIAFIIALAIIAFGTWRNNGNSSWCGSSANDTDSDSDDNISHHSHSDDSKSNFWLWMIVAILVIIGVALMIGGAMYYRRNRSESLVIVAETVPMRECNNLTKTTFVDIPPAPKAAVASAACSEDRGNITCSVSGISGVKATTEKAATQMLFESGTKSMAYTDLSRILKGDMTLDGKN